MKRILLLTTVSALLFSTAAHAQLPLPTKFIPKFDLGVKVGANFDQLNSTDTWSNSYKAGIQGGLTSGLRFKRIGVRVEALVSSVKYDFNGGGGSVRNVYLHVPVMLEIKLIPRIWLQLGPQYSNILSAKASDGAQSNVKDYFNTSEVSAVGGLEARLPLHLIAGARYMFGLTDMNNTSTSGVSDTWKQRVIQLYVGFRFL